MKIDIHDRIEAIAGAIALGEASDGERCEYRAHIASCSQCLAALGGEHEIERIASTVGAARDAEVWEPDLREVVATHSLRRAKTLRWSFGLFGIALAVSFGVHALLAAGVPRITVVSTQQARDDSQAMRVGLDENTGSTRPAVAAAPPQRLIVTHNVVQLARAPLPASVAAAPLSVRTDSKPADIIAITVHPQHPVQPAAKTPGWRSSDPAWRTVATTTTTSVTETAPETLTHSAESLQVAPRTTREVAPVGGEASINPQPPMIAYDEGADGTTVFEVLVDERGTPTRCVITKSAGYPVLDDAVCKAAMKARYTPKMIDGRAVPGAYHDAFTFHTSDQTSSEGIPSDIPSSQWGHNQRQVGPFGHVNGDLPGPGAGE